VKAKVKVRAKVKVKVKVKARVKAKAKAKAKAKVKVKVKAKGEGEGEGEGEGAEDGIQTSDQNGDFVVDLDELLRVIQLYNTLGYHCASAPGETEDGYVPGPGANHDCAPYDTDYAPQDWVVSLDELLRVIQFYNTLGYHYCPQDGTEDGFCPGA
jgi:hypothetical protein